MPKISYRNMHIDIITIFPKMFDAVLNESIMKRAQKKGLLKIKLHNLRDYTKDKYRKVDDRPYGGGPGMIMGPQAIFNAVKTLKRKIRDPKRQARIILLSPQGKKLDQKIAKGLAKHKHLILICGHYEGIDERVREYLVDEEISIGDYVLTGGELPAMILVDCVARLVPGVLGRDSSSVLETFEQGLLEYPQYTRPANFNNYKVPRILLSGDHARISQWRRKEALRITCLKRPDLLERSQDA
jgi:tRNA (guanine37-N1)-methyltransferase